MKEWILSIVITVLLISVFSIILPKGKNGTLVKAIFHLVLISVILKPILTNNLSLNELSLSMNSDMEIQQGFIDEINIKKIEVIKEKCILILENNGISKPSINLLYSIDSNQNIIIEKVNVNLENSVIISPEMNIDIIGRTKSLISKNLNINESMVEVYV